MLSALEDATGSFPEAIAICGRLLGARGRVYPSTLEKVVLCAEACDGVFLGGQARACKSKTALHRAWLESDQPIRRMAALDAIRQADLIVLGPGSLFTSIIPNLLVPGVIDAIRESHGVTMFVCSLADMQGETWGLSAKGHYEALVRHGMDGLVDYMLVHSPEPLRPARRLRPHGGGASPGARDASHAQRTGGFCYSPRSHILRRRLRHPAVRVLSCWFETSSISFVPPGTTRTRCVMRAHRCPLVPNALEKVAPCRLPPMSKTNLPA